MAFLGILKKEQIHIRKVIQNLSLKCKLKNMVHTVSDFLYIFHRLNTILAEKTISTRKCLISSLSHCSNAVDFSFAF